jgi:putative heme-binding domain-containing protein
MPQVFGTRKASTGVLVAVAVAVGFTANGLGIAQVQSTNALAIGPVAAWAAGPIDVVAAFDRAFDPAAAAALVGQKIPYYDQGSGMNDRAEARPLGSLRIVGARLTDGGRTLSLATDPHPRMARYLLPLPPQKPDKGAKSIVAGPPGYDLGGVDVTWSPEVELDDHLRYSGWWPVLDLEATRRLTQGSKPHEDGLALLSKPGQLVLSTWVRLPRGKSAVSIESSQPILEAMLGELQAEHADKELTANNDRVVLNVASEGVPLFLTITCQTGSNARPFSLNATYRVENEKSDHGLERDQLFVPWAPFPSTVTEAPLVVPDLSGGDPVRGRTIFSGEQGRCAQCHAFRGQGGKVGPDLTEFTKKGRAEIYRAIAEPSASIEPEYTSYSVATKAGQVAVGVVRAEDAGAIRVTDTNAHAVIIARDEIEQIRPSANSIMPVGLTGVLGAAALRDLIAFLASQPTPVDKDPSPHLTTKP